MDIQNKISPLIESQFPEFYKEEGPVLIAFITEYYKWLELEGNTLYQGKRLAEYRDIDTTIDDFIIHFKEKYLKNIQFDIATNKKLLIKNSFDLYRSKGTERAIDLFFKLIYGQKSEVYYPGDDVFKLSDGEYVRPQYLEVTESRHNINYVGKQITGAKSGATAFVEKYIKRKTNIGSVYIMYVSNIAGKFIPDEAISYGTIFADIPKIIGSLRKVEIVTGGKNFSVGDIVNFISSSGIKGQGIVSTVSNATGIVDFLFVDGGWGYTTNTEVIVSDRILTLTNTTYPNTNFVNFEKIIQPLANVVFTSANANFSNSESIVSNSGATGIILKVNQTGANGYAFISVTSGTFGTGEQLKDSANTKVATIGSVVDHTASGKLMHNADIANLEILTIPTGMAIGQEIYQANSSIEFANGYITATGNSFIQVSNVNGTFTNALPVIVRNSTINTSIRSVVTDLGLYQISNIFQSANVYAYGLTSNAYGYVFEIGQGSAAGFEVGSITEVENIFVNTDLLSGNGIGYIIS